MANYTTAVAQPVPTLSAGGDSVTLTTRPENGIWVTNLGTAPLYVNINNFVSGTGAQAGQFVVAPGAARLFAAPLQPVNVVYVAGTAGTPYQVELG